ncbi:hypothetical protein H257_14607 [Aphanomyces astaci]|uniref:Crinkler effector protein N-terminal domain-containing protein n=1 Tax=Aphanomyces astaci TaxID=112090 RepID=W4FS49_APHAT|nr:hypothetical protein H257_14607 [Aphanomyces astaci]ETV69781.1 hypothetical protein H257_14607 [Aphanomyces astaci]|eukprot:XP_009840795.1 hypothetical protein H257_14607 [Aphanomyces astaci]
MPRLFCIVVGTGRPFSVTIPEDKSVGMLKDKIAIKAMYQFPADKMDLFMAKDGTGFSCKAAAAVTLADLQDYASQLFCVVVGGTGCPFPVTIGEDETVGVLKDKIAIKAMYQFPADEMDLFMAKDGTGFSCETAAAVTLADLQDVQRFKAMGPTISIKKAFGGTFPSNEEEVYVFAVAPEQPAASSAASLVEIAEGVCKKHKRDEDEGSLSISKLTFPKITELGYSMKGWMLPPVDGVPRQNIPDFEWMDGVNETDSRNVQRYKDCVAYMLRDFPQLMITTTVHLGLSTPWANPDADSRGPPTLVMVIELKKHDTLSVANIAQTARYLLAAHTLFDKQAYRPTPVGVLTNLQDEWLLCWVDRNGEVCMMTMDRDHQKLTRETAWQYIRKHCEYVNSVLREELAAGGTLVDDLQALKLFPVFGDTNTMGGQVRKFAPLEYEDNMADVLETEEEVLLYQMYKRLQRTTAFDMPYAAMYS